MGRNCTGSLRSDAATDRHSPLDPTGRPPCPTMASLLAPPDLWNTASDRSELPRIVTTIAPITFSGTRPVFSAIRSSVDSDKLDVCVLIQTPVSASTTYR